MAWPAWAWAEVQSEYGQGKKAYIYHFDRPTARDPDGSGHGSEVAVMFDTPERRPGHAPPTDADIAVSRIMQGYWINFAKTGDPNGAGLPDWPALGGSEPRIMRLGAVDQSAPAPNLEKLLAIDGLHHTPQGQAAT